MVYSLGFVFASCILEKFSLGTKKQQGAETKKGYKQSLLTLAKGQERVQSFVFPYPTQGEHHKGNCNLTFPQQIVMLYFGVESS